jgi:O-succinylbenzoate synthase
MSLTRAYEEVIDFIAAGTSPDDVVAFRASEAARQRVAELVDREKTTGLGAEERSELEHYLQLEHLMRLAKARARKHLSLKQVLPRP